MYNGLLTVSAQFFNSSTFREAPHIVVVLPGTIRVNMIQDDTG
jgi:hypothetical protein